MLCYYNNITYYCALNITYHYNIRESRAAAAAQTSSESWRRITGWARAGPRNRAGAPRAAGARRRQRSPATGTGRSEPKTERENEAQKRRAKPERGCTAGCTCERAGGAAAGDMPVSRQEGGSPAAVTSGASDRRGWHSVPGFKLLGLRLGSLDQWARH